MTAYKTSPAFFAIHHGSTAANLRDASPNTMVPAIPARIPVFGLLRSKCSFLSDLKRW